MRRKTTAWWGSLVSIRCLFWSSDSWKYEKDESIGKNSHQFVIEYSDFPTVIVHFDGRLAKVDGQRRNSNQRIAWKPFSSSAILDVAPAHAISCNVTDRPEWQSRHLVMITGSKPRYLFGHTQANQCNEFRTYKCPIIHQHIAQAICPPKFCIIFVFHFSWVLQPTSQEKLRTMQNFGGKQGAFWEMCKWRNTDSCRLATGWDWIECPSRGEGGGLILIPGAIPGTF